MTSEDMFDENSEYVDDFDLEVDDPIEGLEDDLAEESNEPENKVSCFYGDTGTLDKSLREVLVKLLRGPYISNEKSDRKHWKTLCDNEALIRSRLHDLFLELVIDQISGYAFAKNVDDDDQDLPKLMRRKTLTNAQSMLLIRVRQLQLRASADNLIAYIDYDDIKEFLRPWLKLEDIHDEIRVNQRVTSAIRALLDNNVLIEVDAGERYMVNNIVAGLLPTETAENYRATYMKFAEKHRIDLSFDRTESEEAE